MLSEIITYKKSEVERSKTDKPLDNLKFSLGNSLFLKALQNPGLNIIAEIKPKSPSAGILDDNFNLDKILTIYNKYAKALSVLTDVKYFAGSFDLLAQASQKSNLPTLCKDFIIDPYQCYLARSCGAEAVLLIVKILKDKELIDLYSQIKELGMTPIVEIQNEVELDRIDSLDLKPEIILINNRNLENFTIDLETTKKLAILIPEQTIVISGSGIESKQDLQDLSTYCTNFLVGSLFMRSPNPEKEFQELTENQTEKNL